MANYQTAYADDDEEQQRILEEYLAMNAPALDELAGNAAPSAPAQQLSVEALPSQSQPAAEPEDPLEAYARMDGPAAPAERPQIPWSSYDAPPQYKEKDNTWLWLAMGLDAVLNQGESLPQYAAQMAAPDNSAQKNWELRNKAMNDASSRAAQQAQAERARMPPRGKQEDPHTLAMRDPNSPETQQWRTAAVAAGIVKPEVAAQMSGEQLVALRPQLGQAVSQEKGFENASKGRVQSHELAVKRQGLANDLATGRITYQDFLAQQRAIDEGEQRAEGEALKSAPTNPAVVQDQSEKYGQELRLRGVDRARAALDVVSSSVDAIPQDADIPGFGLTGNVPGAVLSAEGKDLRRRVNELMDTKLRVATGAAAPPSEEKTFREILGIGTLSTDEDLRSALRQARELLDTQAGYVAEMYPSARQAGGVARPQQRKPRKATPRPAESMAPANVVPADDLEF